jgi:hypothetical protein
VKFILILIMCSGITGTCIQPFEHPVRFESMYECLQFGYHEASKKLAEIGPDKVNEAYAHIKFYCQPISEV